MPQTSLNRSILKLAVPNIISNITVPLLGFVDMICREFIKDNLALVTPAERERFTKLVF